ncbi:MAG: endonuclease III [Aquificae bacterium]|nr:endonuclease III [Aquificota bacterium]
MDPTRKVVEVVRRLERFVPALEPPVHRMFEVQGRDHYRILVCGILSARSRDEKTVPVCRRLFERYPTPEKLARAPLSEVEEALKGIGLHRQKAKYLKEAARMLVEDYGGRLPDRLEELVKFPGVGRKVANVILTHAHGKDAVAVDTHVHRISNLLGLVQTRRPEETERELLKITPDGYKRKVNYLLVGLGQTICDPKRPKCERCPLKDLCDFYLSSVGG